jgi:phage terminase small subunit
MPRRSTPDAQTPPKGGAGRGLTPKQQLFVEAYLGRAKANGTEAARLAGYRGSDASLAQIAHENLRKLEIAKRVAARLEEVKAAMAAEEVLATITDHARGTMDDFFDIVEVESKVKAKVKKDPARCDDVDSPADEYEEIPPPIRRNYPVLNLQKAKDRGKLHLVRKISFNQFGPTLELYSSQSALELLGRHHKLFTDKVEIDGPDALAALIGADPTDLPGLDDVDA